MKLAFSTNAYLKFSFADTVRRLARIGYAGVEIKADVPHVWPACLRRLSQDILNERLAATHGEERFAVSSSGR